MGMAAGGHGGGSKSEINVTPLVDVCLVLLIIFMVMVPRKVPEISVAVPPESKKPPTKANESLVVGLSKEGAITLNFQPMVDKQKLQDELTRQLEFRDKKVVFVDFDPTSKYGDAVALLDVAKKSGAELLGIKRDKDKKTPDLLAPGAIH